jgi:general secretion pathway protein K
MSSRAPMLGMLAGSSDSRVRALRPAPLRCKRRPNLRERGVALLLAMGAVLILAVALTDMHEATGTSYALAMTQRDQLQAEYLARSGVSLTRLLIAAEPQIRRAVEPFFRALTSKSPPQLPVWQYANDILAPFCNYEATRGMTETTGVDFSAAEGIGNTGGICQVTGFSENSKLNLNQPLHLQGNEAQRNTAMMVYAMIGGLQSPSPYDPLFEERDPDGLITSRLDIVTALIDWWDADTQRAAFDAGAQTVSNSGAEDDVYTSFRDPYHPRNAPFDSLEELRLVRGVGDDFWATFVEPDPDDPTTRAVTIYGSGKVNPNEADPLVLLARTCSIVPQTTLCTSTDEQLKFINILRTARTFAPGIPFFSTVADYLEFLRGQGQQNDLYPMLQLLPDAVGGLFTPITIPANLEPQFNRVLVFSAAIITVQSVGWVGNCEGRTDDDGLSCGDGIDNDGDGRVDDEDAGCTEDARSTALLARCTRVRIRTVLNFDPRWTPPPPNAGTMPMLGVAHHWRMD